MKKSHNYTVDLTVKNWEVKISPSTQYGYFENSKDGSGGGLWFEADTLVDYDGVFELPKIVADVLSYYGYNLGDTEPGK